LLLITALILILPVELASFLILKNRHKDYPPGENLTAVETDDYMGYVLKKNTKHRAIKSFPDGRVVYDVLYTADRHRRRDIGQEYKEGNPHLILFGCSFVYGQALADKDTLQYMLAEGLPGYNVYNYGVPAYGPQHMLALLEKGDLPSQVESERGLAVYTFYPHQVYRAIMSTRVPMLFSSPYYYLDSRGILQRGKSFAEARPITSCIYRAFLKLQQISNFIKLTRLNLPPKMSKKDIYLTSRIILEAKRLYEKQFDGKFYVLIHPFYSEQKKRIRLMTEFLENGGIKVLYYHHPGNMEDFTVKHDGHPNAEINKFLADELKGSLEPARGYE
jgi:hypothetical protein